MIRSVGAVLVGYLLLAVTVAVKFLLVRRFSPGILPVPGEDVFPHTGWLLALLGSDIALMIAAGYVTARVARRAPLAHAVVLGALMVVLGLTWMFAFQWLPLWYQVVLVSIAIPAAATGGSLGAQSPAARL